MKHTNEGECYSCDAKLEQADDILVGWFCWLKTKFPSVHISWSWRSKNDQNVAFAAGRSTLIWPNSRHNKMKEPLTPKSEALDLFELLEDGSASFGYPFYDEINIATKAANYPITWGGTFGHLKDFDHFEIEKESA